MPGPTPAHAHVIQDDDEAPAAAQAHAGAVALADALLEVPGTRSALNSRPPLRSWRDTRTHTPHAPARRKIQQRGATG
ncbi:hypothetical protein [Streptomyces sp. JH002]|uniref:hypothetical protein n=1 Tax=Streptomyces sp. JH002 TaxID=2763259 RepID=UPI003D805C44